LQHERGCKADDYSSIYYDYLLLDKQIGITLDDFEEYSKTNGFPFQNVLDVLKGEYMYSIEDLLRFITQVSNGEDCHREERKEINALVNQYKSGGYSEFVLQYLEEKKSF
jgi:CDP-glycerol glycerophosphotransferase (TagB/SpsB family)